MKNSFLFLAILLITFSVGCVGPRTASIGHKYVPPIVTTNMVGTTTSYQVGGEPATVTTTTNWSVLSTPPVEERTWKEKVLGKRAPGATVQSYIPPFPGERVVVESAPAVIRRGSSGGYYRGSPYYNSYGGSVGVYGGRSSLGQSNARANMERSPGAVYGQPNPRSGLQKSPGAVYGQPNPRANLQRSPGAVMGQSNPRANLSRSSGAVMGQPNPRANLQRSPGAALGQPNPRANR